MIDPDRLFRVSCVLSLDSDRQLHAVDAYRRLCWHIFYFPMRGLYFVAYFTGEWKGLFLMPVKNKRSLYRADG